MAKRIKPRVPPCVTFDDLKSAGVIGLIEAVDRFDSSRGLKFRSYAQHRIWGAMVDFLRGEDPLSWGQRRRVRESSDAGLPVTISIDQLPCPTVDRLLYTEANSSAPTWLEIRSAAQTLSARERRVITFIYEQEWRNREIADALKVNESRVSQIKHRALSKLRSALKHQEAARAA